MRAITVSPGRPDSLRLADVPEPPAADGPMLVQTVAIGVCGTDREIASGTYGWAPPGRDALVIGHEAVGQVIEGPPDGGVRAGDYVVPIVRRPDPVPCAYCAIGEWDMCRNGRFTERGIKERDGYASERFRIEPDFVVQVPPGLRDLGVLIEPASVVAKAWEHAERIGGRSRAWRPRTALITGAGPIGLLAALMGTQRGLDVHVYDRVRQGVKPQLVRSLGATYHGGDMSALDGVVPDVIIECTGAASVIADAVVRSGPSGVVCLAGISSGGHDIPVDLGAVNRRVVLENDAIFGSVNANRSHYLSAAASLSTADRRWLSGLITRRVTLEDSPDALRRHPDDVKVVIAF